MAWSSPVRFAEIDLLGVYLSPFVPMLLSAWLITAMLSRIGARLFWFGRVWHPSLFTLCLFVVVLAALVLARAA